MLRGSGFRQANSTCAGFLHDILLFITAVLAWSCAAASFTNTAQAQSDLGCCQFLTTGSSPARRCATLTRTQCDALRPTSTFFRGQRCDSVRQRCVFQLPPTTAPTPTPTSTAVASPTPTPTKEPRGCCEVAASRAVPFPFCGNSVSAAECFGAFGFRAAFCENCTCSAHSSPGFQLVPGGCVPPAFTPTPVATRTPTLAPSPPRRTPPATPTATYTPTPGIGCCEVPVSGGQASFCGNQVRREVCLGSFPGASFCPTCRCSSHSEAGFGTQPGRCVPQRPPRQPRPGR
jgi:hypothetical protein